MARPTRHGRPRRWPPPLFFRPIAVGLRPIDRHPTPACPALRGRAVVQRPGAHAPAPCERREVLPGRHLHRLGTAASWAKGIALRTCPQGDRCPPYALSALSSSVGLGRHACCSGPSRATRLHRVPGNASRGVRSAWRRRSHGLLDRRRRVAGRCVSRVVELGPRKQACLPQSACRQSPALSAKRSPPASSDWCGRIPSRPLDETGI
jgi:hypothetical protein